MTAVVLPLVTSPHRTTEDPSSSSAEAFLSLDRISQSKGDRNLIAAITACIREAIALEKSGAKVRKIVREELTHTR
jgi:hypothetical protein